MTTNTFRHCINIKIHITSNYIKGSNYDQHVQKCQYPDIIRKNLICIQRELNTHMHPINDLIKPNY